MLKITIDNEEVLSNKNFTIEEEMLNTPSVILDNVYPKSWENDKDYVSRFYHPNDYSKCLIEDEIYTPAEPGLNEEGTNFQITADTNKLNELTSMKGQTTQDSTPTPDAPVEVKTVTGRQEVSVAGKNLLNINNWVKGRINNTTGNIEYANNVSSMTIGETDIKFIVSQAWNSGIASDFIPISTGTYAFTFSHNREISVYIDTYNNQNVRLSRVVSYTQSASPTTRIFTISDSNVKYIRIHFEVNTANVEYIVSDMQLEKGSATTYEPYIGNTYEINLGKNLSQLSSISTTNGGYINRSVSSMCEVEKGITYTLSFKNNSSYTNGCTVRIWHDNTYTDQLYKVLVANSTMVYTFTATNSGTLHLSCKVANDMTDIFTEIQVEKGSQATTYAPYKTPIELCKIGNYQDRIFKSSGKNLFNTWNSGSVNLTTGEFTTTARNRSDYIEVQPSTNYTLWRENTGFATYSIEYDNNHNFIEYKTITSANTTLSFTTTATTKYIVLYQYTSYAPTNRAMLNEGSAALPYEPYGSGTWYLEKNIGKVVLNGSETWNRTQVTSSNSYAFWSLFTTLDLPKPKYNINTPKICNYFPYEFKVWNQSTVNHLAENDATNLSLLFNVDNSIATTVTQWNNWLSTHNTTVYYVLATPTTTEITDSELISQLESIELLEGLNNVSVVSPYLQGIINLHYNFQDDETTSNLLFCGVVKNSGNISLNPRYPHYQSLQILDFKTFLSEGETLDFVIANKTIEEAIDQIISTIAPYGFVKGNIQIIGADTIIGAYSTKDKTAYDVFNYIADITQSRWTTRLIDENIVAIDFYDPTLLPQGTPINYTTSWFRDNLIDDMSYSYGSNDYRNKQVMTSNEVYGSILQTQTIVANGYQTQFDTELKIGQITSITANGTQLTIATNEQKELGFNADIYYTPGNNYFESADLKSTGEILIVNYIAIVEGRQIITNGTEINRVATATGRKGIVARYENRNDANTSNELQLIGQSYIRYKGTPEIKLTIVSRSNIWNVGDRVQFNAPINELATEYMVKKKTINRILANPSSEEHIVYTYEMTSSFNSEQAINYFDNQRAKAKGNIGESEYITRNVDIENIANIIFYGSNVEQATITGDNTLQATLSSPIIN